MPERRNIFHKLEKENREYLKKRHALKRMIAVLRIVLSRPSLREKGYDGQVEAMILKALMPFLSPFLLPLF